MTLYKEIDNGIWSEFGKALLSSKGSKMQVDFLQSCRDGKDVFLQYLNGNLFNEENAIIAGKGIFLNHKFTEAEFRFPPTDTQQIIWDAFKEVPRQNTGSCGFWGSIIVDMIKHDCITPNYLASNVNGVNETGFYMLDRAITSEDGLIIDECVRRILRSMGNPGPRGKRIIFNDFYLGKAYWRWNWSNKMSNKIDLSFEEILNTLDDKGYAEFSGKMHTKKSYISQTNTFGGLLSFLSKNPDTLVKSVGRIIDNLTYLSIWKAIEIQSPESNEIEIENIARSL